MNKLFPIFLNLGERRILVVGAGEVAQRKMEGLIQSGSKVTVIAPEATPAIEAWHRDQKIRWEKRVYAQGDVNGYLLVLAATNQREINRQVFQDAQAANVLINVVDDPPLCNFYYPAVYQDGDLKVAVSTNGKSPRLAQVIRDTIKEQLGDRYGALISKVGQIRESLFHVTPDTATRKRLIVGIIERLLADMLPSVTPATFANQATVGRRRQGKVALVGAGPGDAELITVKGLKALQRADVIVYDALVNPALLLYARESAELIFAGKRRGAHGRNQAEINQLILDKSRMGKSVVRLKGGDPFIYGRGGEEAEVLAKADIDFEIIPGITAGIAAPAYAGIPLTSRGYSSSVAFITGHQFYETDPSDRNLKKIATGTDTLVIYMGAHNIVQIAHRLIAAGRLPDTPIAVVQRGTLPDQRTYTGTLADLLDEAQLPTILTPAVIVIGKVVELREKLRWYDKSAAKSYESLNESDRIKTVIAASVQPSITSSNSRSQIIV